MSDIVLRVENLSKLYRLGEVGTGTLAHDLNRWFARVRGKEDPFSKVGEINDRTSGANSKNGFVWSLKDINFDIRQGDVVGIIGKNGAGKSTLLKVISQITAPTSGCIKAKGRIASLLEVGTGMHPEMTGRENIYLNGTILGMRKWEIDRKFDEIIDFAGCAKYVDTPVKRYSSGMKVRLGFAVAAFLEPEILIVDEVLAVGDAEFQKKAIGKMQDVSKSDGRTVLFVSHNMPSVKAICNSSIILQNGMVKYIGAVDDGIQKYFEDGRNNLISSYNYSHVTINNPYIVSSVILDSNGISKESFSYNDSICIDSCLDNYISFNKMFYTVLITSSEGDIYIHCTDELEVNSVKGNRRCCIIPKGLFKAGKYFVTLALSTRDGDLYQKLENVMSFEIIPSEDVASRKIPLRGLCSPKIVQWKF